MKKFLLAILLAAIPSFAQAQAAPNVDSNDNFAWNQTALTLAEAQAYVYKYYLDGATTGSVWTPVTCSGTATPFTCQAKTPAFSNGNHSLTITAASANGESAPSSPFAFVFGNPPPVPNNLRIIKNPGSTMSTTPTSKPPSPPPAPSIRP